MISNQIDQRMTVHKVPWSFWLDRWVLLLVGIAVYAPIFIALVRGTEASIWDWLFYGAVTLVSLAVLLTILYDRKVLLPLVLSDSEAELVMRLSGMGIRAWLQTTALAVLSLKLGKLKAYLGLVVFSRQWARSQRRSGSLRTFESNIQPMWLFAFHSFMRAALLTVPAHSFVLVPIMLFGIQREVITEFVLEVSHVTVAIYVIYAIWLIHLRRFRPSRNGVQITGIGKPKFLPYSEVVMVEQGIWNGLRLTFSDGTVARISPCWFIDYPSFLTALANSLPQSIGGSPASRFLMDTWRDTTPNA